MNELIQETVAEVSVPSTNPEAKSLAVRSNGGPALGDSDSESKGTQVTEEVKQEV